MIEQIFHPEQKMQNMTLISNLMSDFDCNPCLTTLWTKHVFAFVHFILSLSTSASSILYSAIRQVGKDILDFLLLHQYVTSDVLPDVVWAVMEGSGQGLVMSGAIANSAFLQSNELAGPSLARSYTLREHNCLYYRRYVDNLFAIFVDESSMRGFLQLLSTRMVVYTGKVEDSNVDLDSVYNIVRTDTGAKIVSAPLLKLSANFLSVLSSHPWSIHIAWPLAYISSIKERSSNTSIFRTHKKLFINALRSQGWPLALLDHFNRETNYHVPLQHSNRSSSTKSRTLWCVLPYHPRWEGIGKALRKYADNVDNQHLICSAFGRKVYDEVRVSFKMGHIPCVASTINKKP